MNQNPILGILLILMGFHVAEKRIEYITAPEIKEAKDLLVRVRDFYTYSIFDILKLGIPTSEQLSKSLTKITNIGRRAADPVEKLLILVDSEENLAKRENKKCAVSLHIPFVSILQKQFSRDLSEEKSPTNFIENALKVGRFIFTEKSRYEYFELEIMNLHNEFWQKKLQPYAEKYNVPLKSPSF